MADIKKDQEREELHRAIWAIADELRGSVDGWDFKSYVLGMMFYRYISENLTNYINEGEIEAGNEGFDYTQLSDEDAEQAREDLVKTKGFFILPSELFCNIRKTAASDENLNMTLETVFKHIEESAKGSESEDNFAGLFDDIDVNSNKLGATVAKRNAKLVKLIEGIANMSLGNYKESAIDAFGDAYEYLMGMYASNAGKSGGEFFTPQEVSELLTRIAVVGKTEVNKVYDPACGSGSLLLKAAKILGKESVRQGFFGQEINLTTYNLCRINMFLHDIDYDKFDIFGFTGTPIFSVNAAGSGSHNLKTTAQAFGDKLHTYTIVDAINDGNVLPFRIDYINTVKQKDGKQDQQVNAIDTEEALASHERISEVVKYILEHFDQKTMRNSYYSLKGQRVNGFNSMLAVSSIPVCKKYYLELKKQIAEQHRDLTIATIFSFTPNEEASADGVLDDESFDAEGLDQSSRDFLDMVILEYNQTFQTRFDTSSKGFQDYYKDLSDKVKKREIDLLIVVNMFLTGFDATTLNTLWVDKNLKMHGLIQAFSRTNRILNSVKTLAILFASVILKKKQTTQLLYLVTKKQMVLFF